MTISDLIEKLKEFPQDANLICIPPYIEEDQDYEVLVQWKAGINNLKSGLEITIPVPTLHWQLQLFITYEKNKL